MWLRRALPQAQLPTTGTHIYYQVVKVFTEASVAHRMEIQCILQSRTLSSLLQDLGFECKGQNYCVKSFNAISTMTYVDATLSTPRNVYGSRHRPSRLGSRLLSRQPVPTDSRSLPRRFLYTREKIGIGIGVPVAVALLMIGGR
ncbi:hypothetical protein PENARI_c015G06036 [Penicillium arizonense]|uniref:Uncharacterized protein n=1 Tax=Penicillium arizonense TaxID=1835702 RepID=A0A1F5LCS8_PENAI|nr:hypothetical protein PENARI_c015G06036 [Penicillium arizonense]OGE51013.1 hypothetical protein PENARI_c015G06036 [Penicillium arizonense]